MIQITRLPEEVKRVLEPLRPVFSYRHFLVFCWLMVAHLACFEKATCKALGRYTPKHIGGGHLRRLIACARWPWDEVLHWLVIQCLSAFPPPPDRVLFLVVDSTLKGKRTKKNPLVKKGRLNEHAPFTWGLHVVLLIAQWGVYRIPLDFRLVKPKKHKGYRSETALFRDMLKGLVLPAWYERVIVVADAAYASRKNLKAIQARGWFFVIAFPRTWKLANGQYLRDIVTHLPIHHYRQVRVPPLIPHARYRAFWTFVKSAHLRHVGDVTMLLSRRRRNDSPKQTKVLVTNLPMATARMIVMIYLRRWPVEICFKELKSGLGLGQAQVTKDPARVERSLAVTLIAYLVLLRLQAKHIRPEAAWSVFALKRKFAWEVGAQQIKRTTQRETLKEIKKLKLAA
jgi:Transposase DDE domain